MSYYPDTFRSHKFSFDKEIAEAGSLLLDYLVEQNLLEEVEERYSVLGLGYIRESNELFVLGDNRVDIPEELTNTFATKAINKLNSVDQVSRIKFEILNPLEEFEDIYNNSTRYSYFKHASDKEYIGFDFVHPSILWHFDMHTTPNNMVAIVFLDSVSENGGGTAIASPSIPAQYSEPGILNEVKTFEGIEKLEDITYEQVIGPAGTILTFNSHLLHRGGVPLDKPRVAMLIDFQSSNPDHFHIN